jgi:prolyl-tRNA synthetase
MRLSKTHLYTLREAPSEAEIPSHIWLIRAGMIRKSVSGIYNFMTFGWRTVRKIEQIVREEMDQAGAQEISTSPVQPAELWHESGRWAVYGPELWRLKDRHGREFALGPTAEEVVTEIVRNEIDSYRQLPRNLYQIQLKYRDEARARYGLIRAREFIMKDSYSFDRDDEGLNDSYLKMRETYNRIFSRCGLVFRPVAADSGPIGGNDSEEFVAFGEYGESEVVYCGTCDFAATNEQAPGVDAPPDTEEKQKVEEKHTPACKSIEEVAGYLNIPEKKTLKAMLFTIYEETPDDGEYKVSEYVVAFLRGDRELNLVKLRNALGGVAEHLVEFADEAAIGPVTGSVAGFTGPIGLKGCRIVADSEIPTLRNLCAGALKEDYHLTGVNYGRDWEADLVADIKLISEGDPCPECGSELKGARGMEVGQIFKLGTKYSEALGATYKDENQRENLMVMGCYGIGVTRTMAAIVEQSHDENGIIWPMPVAPFHVIICPVMNAGEEAIRLAGKIYEELLAAGIEAVIDDRDERPGVKFKDADIIGIPIRITVGKKAAEGIVEYKRRHEKESAELVGSEAVKRACREVLEELELG